MEEIGKLITSPAWWFTTFVAAVAVNLFSHWLVSRKWSVEGLASFGWFHMLFHGLAGTILFLYISFVLGKANLYPLLNSMGLIYSITALFIPFILCGIQSKFQDERTLPIMFTVAWFVILIWRLLIDTIAPTILLVARFHDGFSFVFAAIAPLLFMLEFAISMVIYFFRR